MKHPHLSDTELRMMRDALYQPTDPESDAWQTKASWEKIKDCWRNDADWLLAQYKKETNQTPTPPKL